MTGNIMKMNGKFNFIHFFTLSLLAVLGVPGSGYSFGFFSHAERDKVTAICEERGGLTKPPGRLLVDGYYLPRTGPMFGARQVVQKLTLDRYQFFEMDTDWVKKHGGWFPFDRHLIGGEGKYIRFYMAEAGDENCKAYENYIRVKKNDTTCAMRARGLYPDHCIAAVKTNTLKSKYGIFVTYEKDPEMEDIEWKQSAIRNIETGEVYADYKSFVYCWKGKRKNGGCSGGTEQRFKCPDIPRGTDRSKTVDAIYHFTFKSNLNPYLKKPLTTVEINEPRTVPIHMVTPELLETVEDKTKIKKLYNDEYFDLSQPYDNEGRVRFGARTVKWVENGTKFQSSKPQLNIIQDKDRKLLKVDINLETGWKYWGNKYSNLRAIPGDAIYFLARKFGKEGNRFWIMRHSWQGKLLRVTAGELPFPIIMKDEYQLWYSHLEILKNEYRFSLLDAPYHGRSEPFHTRKELKYRIPFK